MRLRTLHGGGHVSDGGGCFHRLRDHLTDPLLFMVKDRKEKNADKDNIFVLI